VGSRFKFKTTISYIITNYRLIQKLKLIKKKKKKKKNNDVITKLLSNITISSMLTVMLVLVLNQYKLFCHYACQNH
jgi:hypothetical protein